MLASNIDGKGKKGFVRGWNEGSWLKDNTFGYVSASYESKLRHRKSLSEHLQSSFIVAAADVSNSDTLVFMKKFIAHARNETYKVSSYATESDVLNCIRASDYTHSCNKYNTVIFKNMDAKNSKYDYKINTGGWPKPYIDNWITNPVISTSSRYDTEHSYPLQRFIDEFIIQSDDKTFPGFSNNILQCPMPAPHGGVFKFYENNKTLFPLLFSLMFLPAVMAITRILVSEKETRMKEMLRMMGLSELQLFGSWFVVYLIYFFVLGLGAAAFLSALVFQTQFRAHGLNYFLYGLCAYAFCYCLTAFFWKARTAVVVISTLWPVLSIVKVFIDDPDELKPDAVFLIPPTAFSLIVDTIAFLESQNSGLTFAVASSSIKGFQSEHGNCDDYIDILIYMLLGAYFEGD